MSLTLTLRVWLQLTLKGGASVTLCLQFIEVMCIVMEEAIVIFLYFFVTGCLEPK